MARESRAMADEYEAKADQYDGRVSPGTPADGHTWRISVSSRGSSSVKGQDGHRDAGDFRPLHNPVEVRAWSLGQALRQAAELPLDAWFDEEDD